MSDLHYLDIGELAGLIASRAISPVEVAGHMLARIDALDGVLHSFATVTPDLALRQARLAETIMAAGTSAGLLQGVPVGIKDLFWTKGVATAAGTAIYRDFVPSEDATAVARLGAAGTVTLGKLQMTEGAYSDHHPSIVPPVNPWNPAYWTGISSSGPGVALAAGLCFGAIASDTGGSIRWPCAANGLTGIKPTWGRVSRYGAFELAASLDHVGTMARSAVDAALLLEAIAGPDPTDPTALQEKARRGGLGEHDLADLRIGIDARWNEHDVDPPVMSVVSAAVDTFRELGATIVEVSAPDTTDAVSDWPGNCAVEAAVAHRDTFPGRRKEYGPVLTSVLEAGHRLSGTHYQEILLRRMALKGRFAALFADVDLLLCPVQPFAPLTLDTIGTMGEQPDLIARLQRFTCPFDMTGGPTVTLPGGHDANGMPVAFQLAAGDRNEGAAIRAAIAFQAVTVWHRRHPPV